jgi:putative ABC transport system permease protein
VTIVGVLERHFTGPTDIRPALWTTFSAYDELMQARPFDPTTRTLIEVYGRLTPTTSLDAAEHELDAMVTRLSEGRATSAHGAEPGVRLYRAASPIDLENPMEAYVAIACLVAVLGLVLALACANAANLLLAAAATRTREIGVRLALGATRGRLVRQLVHESLLLGLMAGGLGFLFAIWLVPVLSGLLGMPPELNAGPDRQVLLFAIVVAIGCGVGAGISPARYGARGDVLSALKEGEGRAARRAPTRLRTSYVGFQAAVSTLLLVVAALLARTAIHMTRTEIGFDAGRLVGVSLSLPRKDFNEHVYLQRAVDAIRAIPLVERVSFSQYQPFGMSIEREVFTHAGGTHTLYIQRSDADLFVTMGVQLLRGRVFTAQEVDREAPVALISDSIARAIFRDADPIGRSVSQIPSEGSPHPPATIVGVVSDTLAGPLRTQQLGTLYRPISRERSNPPSLIVRTANPHAAARVIEEALRPLDPRARIQTSMVGDRLDAYLEQKRRFAWLAGPVAMLALVLAALGVYGVTAFVVSQRTHEVSVRMAVGASAADVLQLLVRQSLRPIVIGLAFGLAAALAVSRVFASELSGISPHDPVAIGVALTVLLSVALIAVIVPARRAARTEPASVLRQA